MLKPAFVAIFVNQRFLFSFSLSVYGISSEKKWIAMS